MLKPLLAASSLFLSVATLASAGPLTSRTDAMLTGATVLTFDDLPPGYYTSLQLNANVRISGLFAIGNAYAGDYNTRGSGYIDNQEGDSASIEFHFASPVSAVGFLWGAADHAWTLEARDSTGLVLESLLLTPTFSSNAGDFFGLSRDTTDISTLRLFTDAGFDFVFVDDLTYAPGSAIPEPGTAGVCVGLFALAAGVWFRRRSTAA